MPDSQLAVGFSEPHVDVFNVVKTQHGNVNLFSVCSYKVKEPVKSLFFCSLLLGVTNDNNIVAGPTTNKKNPWRFSVNTWHRCVRFLAWVHDKDNTLRLAGDYSGEHLKIALMKVRVRKNMQFYEDVQYDLRSTFGNVSLESSDEEEEKEEKKQQQEEQEGDLITAVMMENDFVVCGDVKGNMWIHCPPDRSSSRKPIHTDRITALRLTKDTIVSASCDKTIKIWDRGTKKQLGMFVCRAPVVLLEVFPEDETKLVCGDQLGNLYFLCWSQ